MRITTFIVAIILACGQECSSTTSHLMSTDLGSGKTRRAGQDRQIQPLSCFSATTGDPGICMFAWNCVEAGGSHLGTCIDRFYFGSCCKLPEVVDHNEIGQGQAPDGILPTDLNAGDNGDTFLSKPVVPPDSSSEGNLEQALAPAILGVSTTSASTTETATESSSTVSGLPTKESSESLEELTTIVSVEDPVAVNLPSQDSSNTEVEQNTDKPPSVELQTEAIVEEVETSTEQVTPDGPPPVVAEVEQHSANVDIPPQVLGIIEGDKPLRNMSRLEACGRRPWFTVENHEVLYPAGVKHGASEAPIKSIGEERNLSGRRNSKFLKTWNRHGRIVNGQTADYGEWPWQVSLRQWRTATYLHKCGCALLSENWAITAAHCVENVSPDDLLLRMGEYDLNSMSEPHQHIDRKVQIVASHPKFDPKTFEYDLALLRFYEPVEFQPNLVPICVPEDDRNLVGETAWVTGWGRLYEDGPLPSVMQEVDLPVINNTMCEKMYRNAGYVEHIPNIFICAGYAAGGKDSCEGDSGGPMVVQRPDGRFMLSGVISWGIGCAEKNQPGVYTRISEFREWINQILQF